MKLGQYTDKAQRHWLTNNQRFSHTWILGKTGYGKSTLLERLAIDDIQNGEGIAFFDPHGSSIQTILNYIPPERIQDTIIFDPSDYEHPIGFNTLENISQERKPFVASSTLDTLKRVWHYTIPTPQFDQMVYNGIAALLDYPNATLIGLKFLLTDESFRQKVHQHIKDPIIKDYWADFDDLDGREQRQLTSSTLNKIGALIADPRIRYVIGQPKNKIDVNDILDNRRILLVSLPQGKLGLEKASIMGGLLLSHIHLNALSNHPPFHIYVDEFHNFGLAPEMLSGIRKFGISLTLAHQYLYQLPQALQEAMIGTVGSIVAFRTGGRDAARLEGDIGIRASELSLLHPFEAYARTSDQTQRLDMPPIAAETFPQSAMKAARFSRSQYAVERRIVEDRITRFIQGV